MFCWTSDIESWASRMNSSPAMWPDTPWPGEAKVSGLLLASSIMSTIRGWSIGSPPPVHRIQAPYSPHSAASRFQSGSGNKSPFRWW